MVQALAFTLLATASPVLAATPVHEAEALRCETERRFIERALRHALAQCRRLDAEAEIRRETFDGKACAARAMAKQQRALAGQVCAESGGSAAESMDGDHAAPRERGLVTLPGGARELSFSRVAGLAVLEGDIVLGKALRAPHGAPRAGRDDIAAPSGLTVSENAMIWPEATVPYDIDPRTPALVRERILSAVEHWNDSTLIRLRPRRPDDGDVLLFFSQEPACWAELGRQGGIQLANLGRDCQRGNAIHEIGHAVGLLHEHTRPDRERHLLIRWDRIQPSKIFNFEITALPSDPDLAPQALSYDLRSVMHYGSYAFSIDGQPTLLRRDGSTFVENRDALTTLDVGTVTGLVLAQAGSTPRSLRNRASERCLTGTRSQGVAGQKARLRACSGRPESAWHLYRDPHSGDRLLVNERSRQCLSVPGASPRSGVALRMLPCNGSDEQRLAVTELPDGSLEIRNTETGLCIGSVDDAGRETGGVVQATCHRVPGQLWTAD